MAPAGVVYRGLWQGVCVAVKFIVSDSPSAQLEGVREAVVSKAVGHPCVVHTYAYHVCTVCVGADGAAGVCMHKNSINITAPASHSYHTCTSAHRYHSCYAVIRHWCTLAVGRFVVTFPPSCMYHT